MRRCIGLTVLLIFLSSLAVAADRDTMVRNDVKAVKATGLWIYNDLPAGYAAARRTGRPLLIVFR